MSQQDHGAEDDHAHGRLAFEELTREIIGAFYAVYNALGYGFLEIVYRNAMVIELRRRGLRVDQEVRVEVFYLGQRVGIFRMDIVVEGSVLVEVKASASLAPSDQPQVFNYLRASRRPVALLLHFGPKPFHKRLMSPIFRAEQ